MKTKQRPDYANWIPAKRLMQRGLAAAAAALVLTASLLIPGSAPVYLLRALLAALTAITLFHFGHLAWIRHLLAYTGGGIQGKILDNVLRFLTWDGNGTLLDIGCGSGALTIKAAKKYPRARVVGMDYWGETWDYAQSQCETNAALESVADRASFQQGDAARLVFADGYFDAAVSNFVFHEVHSQPDKLLLLREALRVLKPGAPFAFEDIFFSESHYPDLHALIQALSAEVTELHFVDMRENDFVPTILRIPMVAGNMGLLCGRK